MWNQWTAAQPKTEQAVSLIQHESTKVWQRPLKGGRGERASVKTKNIANTISVLRKMLEKLKWDAETSSLTSWHDSCCPLCRGSDTEYLLVFESATADSSAASALEVVGPAASLRLNEPALALPIVREQSSLQKLIRAVQRF